MVFIFVSRLGGADFHRCLQEKTRFLNCVFSKQNDVGEATRGFLVGGKLVFSVCVCACVLMCVACQYAYVYVW